MTIKTDDELFQLHSLITIGNIENADPSDIPSEARLLMRRFALEQLYENSVDVKNMKTLAGVETTGTKYDTDGALAGLNVMFNLYLENRKKFAPQVLGQLATMLLDDVYANGVDLKQMKEVGIKFENKLIDAAAKKN